MQLEKNLIIFEMIKAESSASVAVQKVLLVK